MLIHLTKKQIGDILNAIGNWTCDEAILKQNYADGGRTLLRAEQKLSRAFREVKKREWWELAGR